MAGKENLKGKEELPASSDPLVPAPTQDEMEEEAELISLGQGLRFGGQASAAWMAGSLVPCTASHTPVDEEKNKESIIGAKRKPDGSDGQPASASSSEGKPAADAKAESGSNDGDVDDDAEVEWVKMPEEYLCWVLAQTRETDPVPTLDDYNVESTQDTVKLERILQQIEQFRAKQDDFFQFQAWVHNTLQERGCVMVPADIAGPKDLLQEAMDEYWDELMAEYDGNSGSEVMPPVK